MPEINVPFVAAVLLVAYLVITRLNPPNRPLGA